MNSKDFKNQFMITEKKIEKHENLTDKDWWVYRGLLNKTFLWPRERRAFNFMFNYLHSKPYEDLSEEEKFSGRAEWVSKRFQFNNFMCGM